jgi:hypothetical protein
MGLAIDHNSLFSLCGPQVSHRSVLRVASEEPVSLGDDRSLGIFQQVIHADIDVLAVVPELGAPFLVPLIPGDAADSAGAIRVGALAVLAILLVSNGT